MLDEIPTISLVSSWKDIKKQVKEDSRYLKFNNSDVVIFIILLIVNSTSFFNFSANENSKNT